MIFYLANGNKLAGTQADARAIDKGFVQHDIPTDKAGLMAYVQELLDKIAEKNEAPTVQEPEPVLPTHADRLLGFEDEWDNFPLARKLHFAALAMEDARTAIKT